MPPPKPSCAYSAIVLLALLVAGDAAPAPARAWHSSGRPLPALPKFKQPVMFNTPDADAILTALQVFPPDNPWNQDIAKLPVAANSADLVGSIGADKSLAFNSDMGFILVPSDQKRVPVKIVDYADESDKGPFPVPDNAPIENWPMSGEKLEDLQRRGEGDRHVLVVDPAARMLYEFYQGRRTDAGWQAAQASVFDLKTNALRREGWTSSDAAGLPVFPAVVRYDECERGRVEHAMRFTVRRSRRAYVHPATHFASRDDDPKLPRMGERFRLRKDFDASNFPPHARAVVEGLKKYGMFVADNGGDWRISVAPDERIKGLETLSKVKGKDFEVVDGGAPPKR